jgi:hypothetical protein
MRLTHTFKSKYADLAEVLNTVRPVFSRNGLAIIQSPGFADGLASITTTIAHASGQYMTDTVHAPVGKQDAQGVGSALTYLRRYSLAAFAGVAQEDDDGNAASQKAPQQARMSADQLGEHCVAIVVCRVNGSVAGSVFKSAWSAVSHPEDQKAITAAKDRRKKELA